MSNCTDADDVPAMLQWGLTNIHLASDPPTGNLSDAAAWQKVPYEQEQICDWLIVRPKHPAAITDPTRIYDVIHSTRPNPTEVELRFQGSLRDFSLGQSGNWEPGTRKNQTKARALQSVTLQDIGNTPAWKIQCEAAAKVKYMVLRGTPGFRAARAVMDSFERETLFVARPAFIDTSSFNRNRRVMGPGHRQNRGPASQFMPAPRLDMKKRLNDGTLVNISEGAFSIGDFVDVTASLEVVSTRPNAVQVHFNLTSIILLMPALEMELIRPLLFMSSPGPSTFANVSPGRRGRDYSDVEAASMLYADELGLDLTGMSRMTI